MSAPDPEEGTDNLPKQDRLGNDFREGPNPNPGGAIETEGSLIPPYEDRAGADKSEEDAGPPG